jgi:2'-5' RNA ligase
VRLFVALAPSKPAMDELDAACAPLRVARGDLRWTSREAWHVTLAFLGEVPEPLITRLMPRLDRAARRHRRFGLSFAGAGAFPHVTRANVLWSGVAGDRKTLGELAMSVAAGARRAGAAPPDEGRRKFRPHLTLARCRTPVDVAPIVDTLGNYTGQPWEVGDIYLIASTLGSIPRYDILGRWDLA